MFIMARPHGAMQQPDEGLPQPGAGAANQAATAVGARRPLPHLAAGSDQPTTKLGRAVLSTRLKRLSSAGAVS